MADLKILVTGSTGSTGKPTVRFLRERGFQVRALVTKRDQRSEALENLGAEIFEGDLTSYNSVREMLKGVQRAYFCYPIRPGLLDATAYFAQAAGEAKLEAIVNMSQKPAAQEAASNASQNHWISERVFDHFQTPVAHIRPTFFAEWFLYYPYMVKEGRLRYPFGTGKHAPITAEDQARVIAAILAEPAEHMGKTYPLYGSKELTFAEMGESIGKALGKEMSYEQISVGEFAEDGKAHGRTMFTPYFIQHVTEVAKDHQNGVFSGMNDFVSKIGGKPPTSIEEFALANEKVFK